MTNKADILTTITKNYPIREMADLIERYAESVGLLPVAQFFVVDRFTLADGSEHPVTPHPFRYTTAKVLEDWLASPGAGISFVVRTHDPADAEALEAYARHKDAAVNERAANAKGKA